MSLISCLTVEQDHQFPHVLFVLRRIEKFRKILFNHSPLVFLFHFWQICSSIAREHATCTWEEQGLSPVDKMHQDDARVNTLKQLGG